MKKKLVAIMLGLTLSFTSASAGVFAEETETETETETENAAISAGIALLEAAAGTGMELYGEIIIINDDGTLVVNTGDLTEDEEDASSATLELSEVYIQFTVAEDVSAGQLTDLLTVTTVDADPEAEADEDADEKTESTTDEDAGEKTESTTDEDAEAASETEETVETESFDVSDFQVGDIIHFTINGSFEIDTVTLIYTQSTDTESEITGLAEDTAAEDETADTEE
ncbi:MAG: hypothetical protein LIP11_18875 [Clostridiales bacterium]|nr:hypothetical protein [Clostridiales bacterium]